MITLPSKPVRTSGERSLWLREALDGGAAQEYPGINGHITADVCIVGGGFTGLWTALETKRREPGAKIVVLEADVCGAGASGRNGGFALSWWGHFRSLAHLCGPEQALTLARRAEQAIERIGEFCREHGIETAFQPSGWVWAATSPAQVGSWSATLEMLHELGVEPFQQLSPREIAVVTGSPTHLAGVYEPGAATIQPAMLARALAQAARGAGIEVHEHSQVTSIRPGSTATVVLERGSITAGQVVLAAGAWAAQIPEIGRGLVVVASDVIATEPVPERLSEIGMNRGVCVSDSRRLVHYYRPTPDGRMVFGKGGGTLGYSQRITASFDHPGSRARNVHSHLIRTYPTLWDVKIADAWSGPIDYSLSGLPFFVRLGNSPNVIVCAGFSGDGVGPSRLAGELLAELLTADSDAVLPAGLRTVPRARFPMPPEPLRYAGGRLVRAAIARKERVEDMALEPDPATKLVASLDPTSFTDSSG